MRHLSIPALLVLLALPALPASAQLAVPNADGITYGHVHLNVTDIEVHKKLWVEHFGGEVVQKGPLTAVRFPNLLIALSEKTPTGGSQGSVMNHFGFKVRSTPDFLEKWKATGLEAADVFIGAEGHRNSYVMMPDGVWVELQEDQALPVEVAGYHIHFNTPDFEALLDWYVDVFSLEKLPRGRITTTTNVPGMNMSFGNANDPTAPTKDGQSTISDSRSTTWRHSARSSKPRASSSTLPTVRWRASSSRSRSSPIPRAPT